MNFKIKNLELAFENKEEIKKAVQKLLNREFEFTVVFSKNALIFQNLTPKQVFYLLNFLNTDPKTETKIIKEKEEKQEKDKNKKQEKNKNQEDELTNFMDM